MNQKFSGKNTLLSSLVLIISISAILITVSGCKSTDVKLKADLLPYMLKPVAFLRVKSPKKLETIWPEMMNRIEQRLAEIPSLGKVIGTNELKKKILIDPKFYAEFKAYLSTLTLTGISDKEIAWKLEREFESPYFLLLDFVSFSCTKDCSSNEQWVIRLKMIEAQSGDLIFLVRKQYQLNEDEKASDAYKKLAEKLTTEVVDEFASGFIVPWHRWRYEHLKPSTVRTERSELGI